MFLKHIRGYAKKAKIKKTYAVQIVKPRHFKQAAEFMHDFFLDDPMTKHMGVKKDEETRRVFSLMWMETLKEGLSLHLSKQIDEKIEIYGLSINGSYDPRSTYREYVDLIKRTGSIEIQNLLNAWSLIACNPKYSAMSQNLKFFEIAGITVARDHRQFGIAAKLLHSSETLAKLKGYDYVRVDATNPITAQMCEKNGYNMVWEKPLVDFDGIDKTGIEPDAKVTTHFKKIKTETSEDPKILKTFVK